MTLREIRDAHPGLFYSQDWFRDELFMDAEPDTGAIMPLRIAPGAQGYFAWPPSVSAATLAWLYVQHPDDPVWERYLWTSDTDHRDQRVYIGKNDGLMEIHRHLHITDRWGVPVFGDMVA